MVDKTTMADIAQYCNVSIKTVSRVINQSSQVKAETKAKVEAAMAKFDFQVNLLARGLKQRKMDIVLVFLDPHHDQYMNSWRNLMLRYLFRCASKIGLKIIVSPSEAQNYSLDQTDGFTLLSSGIADGAILFEYIYQDKRVAYLQKRDIPYVILGQPRESNLRATSLDNYQVGWLGAKTLAESGYKSLAFLTGSRQYFSTQTRVKGFCDGVEEMGRKGRVVYDTNGLEETYRSTLELCAGTDSPDALLISGDERAVAVYKALGELDRKIPAQIGIIGIDDLPWADYLVPALSTLKVDLDELAQECIGMLVSLGIQKDKTAKTEEPDFPVSQKLISSVLVKRQSTK